MSNLATKRYENPEQYKHRIALGEALREERSLVYSQADVRYTTGVPRTMLSDYERGVAVPSLPNFEKLLNFYNVEPGSPRDRELRKLWEAACSEIRSIRS